MMKTLIKDVFLNGKTVDVLVAENLIAKIGSHLEDAADKIINAKNKAILPSFYNTHTHAAMMFLRGIGEDKDLFSWLQEDIWPREAKLSPEMIYHLSRFAILEMIKTGTTFFSDMYFYSDQTLKAAEEMGVRAAISALGMDFFDAGKRAEQQANMKEFLQQKSHPRITRGLSLHAIYSTSRELYEFAAELAETHQTFLHTHAAETLKEVNDCFDKYQCRPIELLKKYGALGPRSIFAHCLHLSEAEMDLMAQSKTAVSHCPSSSLKLNSGQMPLQQYLDKGMIITLGTDGVSSNNSLSMPAEMKIAALSAKNRAKSTTAAKVEDVFAMATVNGARTFGIDSGEIKEGKLADFILVDLNNYLLLPNHNLISNMIYAADSSCICDVFCDGRQVMKDFQVENEAEIVAEFKKVCAAF